MMKRYVFMLWILMGLGLQTHAEESKGFPARISARYIYGGLMKGSRIDPLIEDRVTGGELTVELSPWGKWEWQQRFNNASMGFALSYLDLGNADKLGKLVATYPYIDIPIVDVGRFKLSVRPGAGISFLTKRYGNTCLNEAGELLPISNLNNPKEIANSAIGSVVNAYFSAMVGMELRVWHGWNVVASAGWNHASNSGIMAPNSGLNMLNLQLGVSYMPYYDTYEAPKKLKGGGGYDRWGIEITGAGGARDLYYRDEHTWGIGTLSVASNWRLAHIFRLGVGIDSFYNSAYGAVCNEFGQLGDKVTYYGKTYITENKLANKFRVGLSVQPEFVFGRLVAGFHFGVYLYDPIKNLQPYAEVVANGGKPLDRGIFYKYDNVTNEDGWLYMQAVAKYMITERFFASIALKTHLHKAEFMAWGVGVRL